MRRAVVLAALLAAVAIGGGCGGSTYHGEGALPATCAGAGFVNGPDVADGRFAARIPAACEFERVRICTVADGHGPITRAIVPARVAQDCFAFNQYVGALTQLPGYESGECFGRARVSTPPHEEFSTFRCDGGEASSENAGTRVAVGEPSGRATVARLRVADPWRRAPDSGSARRARPAPPWSLLLWRVEHNRLCYAPGQVLGPFVGSLRFDGAPGPGRRIPGLGWFTAYDPAVGGSCGEVDAGTGLLVSWQSYFPRRDQGFATTVAAGVAGARVRAVEARRGARWRALRLSAERAFAVTARGIAGPRQLPLRVVYRDGAVRNLG